MLLRASFPSDDIRAIGQGVRGADLHQIVIDSRGRKGCTRFALIDGVLVTDFACAPCLAGVLRANLFELAPS